MRRAVEERAKDQGAARSHLRGEPIARVEPVVKPKKRVRLGALKGWMEIKGDIIHSDMEKDWLVR